MSSEQEEYEEIPWSSLVADARSGPDRRWYLIALGIGVLIVAVIGTRLVGDSGRQPMTAPVADSTTTTTDEPSPGSLVVTEAELKPEPDPDLVLIDLVRVRAEWFVTDLYTHDGSAETARSVRAAVGPLVDIESLPARDSGPATFVEWAKAFRIQHEAHDEYVVSVAYRRIRSIGESFEREPVRAVSVPIRTEGGTATVMDAPTEIDVP